jgi:hypothetical protein
MRDTPPPSTMTSGSSRLITDASARASRDVWRSSVACAAASPAAAAATRASALIPAGDTRVVARQAGAADQRLDATLLAAVAGRLRVLPRHRPGQRVVAPFAGQAVGPAQHAAVHRDARPGAGADDGGEDHVGARAGAVGRFAQGQAVGVVLDAQVALQQACRSRCRGWPFRQVELQFFIKPSGVALPGVPMPTVNGPKAPAVGLLHQAGHGLQDGAVVTLRRGDALAPHLAAVGCQQPGLDLGAAQVDAQRERGRRQRHSAAVRACSQASACGPTRAASRSRTVAW